MDIIYSPSIPNAHQQIRLGDIQASAHKWSIAIEYYIHAIEYFKAMKNTLHDNNLISIIQAQIIQCEKTINLCRLKDRSEQAINIQQAEHLSKKPRAQSTSNLKSLLIKPSKTILKQNTIQLENTTMPNEHDRMDSFTAFIFQKQDKSNEINPIQTPPTAKKNKKHNLHKLEELQTSNEALKTHLKTAYDDIERLKYENNQLRIKKEINLIEDQNQSKLSINTDEEEDQETDLEATL